MKKFIQLFALILLLTSCQNGRESTLVSGNPVSLSYAENLTLTDAGDYIQAVLRNPWDTTAILQTYLLVPKESPLPGNLPNGVVIRTPLERTLVYSAVHCGMLYELGKVDAIAGVCDKQYIKLPSIQEGIINGTVADCGDNMNPNIEAIIQLNPEAVLLSPYQNSGDYGKLGKLGIPIMQCADYMETSALGRAEWVRFYGLLYGCSEQADALFDEVEKQYNALKEKASQAEKSPKVLSDTRYGQLWYVPGYNSTVGRIYKDAKATNPFDYLQQSGSAALATEQVLDKAHDADVWVLKFNQTEDKTLEELAKDADINTQFKAFKEGNVWGCNTGISNFYEEAPYHPHLLLEDLIRIFHPGLLDDGEMHYYHKLK